MSLRQRTPRIENEKHRKFVASLGCLLCGREDTQAAHVSFADLSIAKPFTAMASKADDCFVVPLCIEHHAQQHAGNERAWWSNAGIDAIKTALAIYSVTGNYERASQIVAAVNGANATT